MPRAERARRWATLALLGALAACHVTVRRDPDNGDVLTRARLLRIEDTRRDEPAFLDSMLTSPVAWQRARAAISAARIAARRHAPTMRALAADADADVAADALFALGLLKDTASASAAASALRRDPAVAAEAAWLLGELGERGRTAIVNGLADASLAPGAQAALLLAAARLRPVPAAAILPFVASGDSGIAWRAAYALARGRSAAGVRTLLAARTSPWLEVREQVARGLGATMSGDSLRPQAVAALAELVRDPSARVRVNAVRALATHGRAHRDAVLAALRDPDAAVRLTAAQSLDPVLDSTGTRWIDAWMSDSGLVVQRAIALGAARKGVEVPQMQWWRTSDDWKRRAAMVEVDGATSGPSRVLAKVERWIADGDGRVRAAAFGAIADVADSAPTRVAARARLRAALTDPDVDVRATALGALSHAATHDDLLAALPAYSASLADGDNDARLAFWTLTDSALRRPVNDSVAPRLAKLARPSDPLERVLAARIPRFAAWRDSTGTARPLEWYEARAREAMSGRRSVASIETDRGTMELALFSDDAPLTVHNFVTLARRGYFDGQRFHRVVPNFVVQGGDPRGDGNGGPGYAIRDEINRHRYHRGTLGMALSGPNTGGSQFFVAHSPQPHLDGGYTVFGQLVSGAETLDRIVQGDRIVRITVR